MSIQISAGVETIEQECGTKDIAFPAETKTVTAADVDAARLLLQRLKSGDSDEFVGIGVRLKNDTNGSLVVAEVVEESCFA